MADNAKLNTKLTDIDKALAAAKARKEAKAAAEANGEATPKASKPKKGEKAEKPEKAPAKAKKTDEDRAAEKAERDAARDARKAVKDAEKASKLAEKLAAKKPAHMAKVLKAAEKLPKLNDVAEASLAELTANLSAAQLAALALHIQHFNRVKATERALSIKIEEGMSVNIIGGDPRYIGMSGTVTKAQRIRCYVEVEGAAKDVYCFTSDVEPVSAEESEATGTEG